MNIVETLLLLIVILILFCLAPILIIPALALIVGTAILWLLAQVSVLVFQGVLVLAGMAIKKAEVYWKNRQAQKTEQLLLAGPVEEFKP